jgi:hypothetical protein
MFGGCTIQTLFNIFKRGLKETLDFDIVGEPKDYLPTIDYKLYKVNPIIDFLNTKKYIKKILISNCDVLSGQSHNFDFNPIINYVSDIFPNMLFIITNVMGEKISKNNIIYFEDIVKCGGTDLNEISFLSIYCDILIGRNSGPHTFCFVKENIMNENKIFICFSHENFGVLDFAKAKIVNSQNYALGNITSVIEQEIRGKLL